jgi:hypothetical protein
MSPVTGKIRAVRALHCHPTSSPSRHRSTTKQIRREKSATGTDTRPPLDPHERRTPARVQALSVSSRYLSPGHSPHVLFH